MEPLDIAIPIASACAVAAIATPLVGRLALALGAVDRPSARGGNQRPNMPLMGGLAVGIAFVAGLFAVNLVVDPEPDPRTTGLLLGSMVILVTGMLDDRFGLNAWWKLSGQLLAAGIAIAYGF